MRESTLQLINYLMIAAVLIALPLHFATHSFLGVASHEESLTYDSVTGRYRSIVTMILLATLLTGASYHGLYGVRSVLLEIGLGPRWNRLVSAVTISLGLLILGWGARTILLGLMSP